jgi:pimeloyl-ACP methyl ester carboxylesterase
MVSRRRAFDIALVIAAIAIIGGNLLLGIGRDDASESSTESTLAEARELFAYDAGAPLDVRALPVIRTGSARLEPVSFSSFDGDRVSAVVARPADGVPERGCAIFQPGLGTTLRGYPVPTELVDRGFLTLTIEPRFTGARARGSVDAFAAARDPLLLEQMMRGSVIDLRRAIDYLEISRRCRGGVGYWGNSFGGLLGAVLAGVDDRVRAAALVVAGGDWHALVASNRIFLPRIRSQEQALEQALRRLAPVDPALWVGEISPRPVLMINGRTDTLIDPPAATALHEAARPPKQIIWYPGGHFEALIEPRPRDALEEFVSAKF